MDKTSAPETVPELVFVRALQWHLPIQDNLRVLKRLTHFGANYVMLSTRLRADRNLVDFVPAMGHPVNLFRPPYCIRDPLALYKDGQTEVDVYIGLWKIEVDQKGHPLPLIGSNKACMPGYLSDTYDYKQYPYLNKLGDVPIGHHPDDYLKPGAVNHGVDHGVNRGVHRGVQHGVVEQQTECRDLENFNNGFDKTCKDYGLLGWCKDGKFVAGQEWTGGLKHRWPERNCCICGGDKAGMLWFK